MTYKAFYYFIFLTEILLLISLLYTYRHINRFINQSLIFLKAFSVFMLFLAEIAPLQLITRDIYLALFLQNVYLVISYILFTKIYRLILNVNYEKVFRFGSFFFFIVLILNLFIDKMHFRLLNYAISCSNLIFTIYSVIYLVNHLQKKNAFELKYFWLNISFLVYNSLLFSVMFFQNIVMKNQSGLYEKFFWSVVLLATFLFNFFLAVFLFKSIKKNTQLEDGID